MIERLDKRPYWFAGEDEHGSLAVWLEDDHVHLEAVEEECSVIALSPAAAVQLAKAILTAYATPGNDLYGDLLTVSQAAAVLGITPRAVAYRTRRGTLPAVNTPLGRLYERGVVEAARDARRPGPVAPPK